MAERELLIWLKPTVAPGAAGAFKSVAEMAKKAHNATAESHSKTTRKMKDELSDYEKSVGKTFKQMEKEDLRRFKAQSQQIKQQAAEQKKAIAEVAREKAKAERDLQRGAQAEVNRQYKQQRMAEQARAKEERAEKQKEKAEERVGKLRLNAMAATLHLGEKLTQVGRGAALLSFMGKKEDMEHVVQGLEAIQGTFDVVSGGLGVLRAGQHAWHAWGAEARMAAKAAGVAKGGLGLAEGAEAIGGVGMAAPMVGKAGAAVASGGVGVGLAGAAAVAAAIFAGYSIYKTGQAISKHGVGGGYDEDTALGRYGNWAGGKLNAGKNWLTRMMGRTNNEIEAEDAEEHRRKQKENTNKYLEQYGPVIQAKREADAQRRQLALGGEQERLSMAYQGVYDPEKIKAKRGFSFAASAGLAEAKRNVIGTEEYYGAAHRSTAEARAGVETAENTHYGQGPEAEEEHLKGVLAAREELTR